MHDQAFVQAIIANSDEDAYRLVYADWLEENGDIDRATFIRLQCELARLSPADGRYSALSEQERAMRKAHFGAWIAPLRAATPFYTTQTEFRRGFVEYVSITSAALCDGGARLFALAPITRITLSVGAEHWPLLPGLGCLQQLREVSIQGSLNETDLSIGTDGSIAALLESSNLPSLKRLSLTMYIGPLTTQQLLRPLWRDRLTGIEIMGVRASPALQEELYLAYSGRIVAHEAANVGKIL